MQIGKLDHVNLRTTQLDTMIAWYENVLGLTNGPRPGFLLSRRVALCGQQRRHTSGWN